MDRCLSESEIIRLMSGGADSDFISAGLKHFEVCSACRTAALQTEQFQRAAKSIREYIISMSRCLGYEQLAAYLDNTLPEREHALVERHLSRCADCQGDLEHLREAESRASLRPHRTFRPTAPVRRRSIIGLRTALCFGLAAGAVTAICLAVLRLPTTMPGRPVATRPSKPGITVPSEPGEYGVQPGQQVPKVGGGKESGPPAKPTDVLRDGTYLVEATGTYIGRIKSSGSGKAIPLPEEIAAAVKAKLHTGRARQDRPVLMAKADMDILRSPDEVTGLEPSVVRPYGTNVLDQTPTLYWEAPERVGSFTVEVFLTSGEEVWKSTTNSKSCHVTVPLKRGETYLWRVGSRVGDETFYSRAVLFKILSEHEFQSLSSLLSHKVDSQLIRGSILESYGLYDEALAEFKMLAKQNPHSQLARRMVDALEKEIQEARK